MTIVGFNFTKMDVERSSSVSGKINITNNVSIKNIEKSKLTMGTLAKEGLKYTFEFVVKYEPAVGSIFLQGEVLSIASDEEKDAILKNWADGKKVSKQVMSTLLNSILQKCNIQSVILSRDINLPSPVPLPKVTNKD